MLGTDYPSVIDRRLITENVEVIYGPNVLSQRQQTEIAYLNATTAILVPAGVCNRWINYTAHPSQTPGEGGPPLDLTSRSTAEQLVTAGNLPRACSERSL